MRFLILCLSALVILGAQSEELTPEVTPELTVLVTNVQDFVTTAPTSPEMLTTSTVKPNIELMLVNGWASFQNRQPDNAGILVEVRSADGQLWASTVTDAHGSYSVLVPADMPLRFVFIAPLHRINAVIRQPYEDAPPVILAGGDLNGDGCIGDKDIAILTAYFNQLNTPYSDINGDNRTDIADLAILTGHYDSACEYMLVTPTAAPMPTASATVVIPTEEFIETTSEATLEVTAEVTTELPLELLEAEELTSQIQPSATLGAEVTAEMTIEMTAEVTPSAIPEITADVYIATATASVTTTSTAIVTVTNSPEYTETPHAHQ